MPQLPLAAQVDGVVLLKQVLIRATSATGEAIDVVIRDDDTLTVRHAGQTTTLGSTKVVSSTLFADFVTVERFFLSTKGGGQYAWRVSFTFGGTVTVWPTRNAGNKARRASDENVSLWLWIELPTTLVNAATGICATTCSYKHPMPYPYCDGKAACLPVREDESIFMQSDPSAVAALESACDFTAAGDSMRPASCTTRAETVDGVNCKLLQGTSGTSGTNRAVHQKWPMNKDLFNGRHSGGGNCNAAGEHASSQGFYTYTTCPETHPYAYNPPNFDFCCASENDNHEGADGINALYPRSGRSTSCFNDAWFECARPPCFDYRPSVCPLTHPFAFNPPAMDMCCGSRNDDSIANPGINARATLSERSQTCRGKNVTCVSPPCADFPELDDYSGRTAPSESNPACPYHWDMAELSGAEGNCVGGDGECATGSCAVGGCRSSAAGTGGCVEDSDCEYGYAMRDIPWINMTSQTPTQECWDFCTKYVNDASASHANRCKARRLLANGGQLFCGYKGGRYVDLPGPYLSRCHVFVFPGDATSYDYHDAEITGPNPPFTAETTDFDFPTSFGTGMIHNGPYVNYFLSEFPCDQTVESTCAPDSEELCVSSDLAYADAVASCSELKDGPLYVLANGWVDVFSEVHKNVPCFEYPDAPGVSPRRYICAIHGSSSGHTMMTCYTFDADFVPSWCGANPNGVGAKFHLGEFKPIDTAAEVKETWDTGTSRSNGAGYGINLFSFFSVSQPWTFPCSHHV